MRGACTWADPRAGGGLRGGVRSGFPVVGAPGAAARTATAAGPLVGNAIVLEYRLVVRRLLLA